MQTLYDDYFEHLVKYVQSYRSSYPPNIDVKEYAKENKNIKKIKDISWLNGGNPFILYRKHLYKCLEILGIPIPMQQLSLLAGVLWKSEPDFVQEYYKSLSKQIKKYKKRTNKKR